MARLIPTDELAAVAAASVIRRHADGELRAAVLAARSARVSWEAIGAALGVTKQTAWERYWRHTG